MTINNEYSNLTYQEIVPIGGIIMYGKAGDNSYSNIDGYLYCDGSIYDITLPENKKYLKLKSIIGLNFYNENNPIHKATTNITNSTTGNDNYLYLTDFRSKSPIGYDAAGTTTRVENGIGNNTQGIGNMGGRNTITLENNNLPSHNHGITKGGGGVTWSMSATTSSNGAHSHAVPFAFNRDVMSKYNVNDQRSLSAVTADTSPGAYKEFVTPQTTTANNHQHTIDVASYTLSGNTNNTGGGQAFNNRSAYVVTNYIIKY